jgi:hypothetical protein
MLKAIANTMTNAGFRPRPPRDDIECCATLCTGAAFLRVQLCDVSRNGCKILVQDPQRSGERVQIALEAYHSLGGTIRWFRKGKAGIQFNRPMSDADLATWTNALARARNRARNRPAVRKNFWGEPVRGSAPR